MPNATRCVLLALSALSGCAGPSLPQGPAPGPGSAERAELVEALRSDLVAVPGGRFSMGSDAGPGEDEAPVREVTIRPFLLQRHEVTADQFARYELATGRTVQGSAAPRGRYPAANIAWHDAMAFIGWLNEHGGPPFRLPTEAEWEYAARGGTPTVYWWGDEFRAGQVNGTGVNGADQWLEAAPVGSLPANPFGLHDMLGNVWEWTADCYWPDYRDAPADGSARPGGPDCPRVLRGGSWSDTPAWLRAATRNWFDAAERFDYVGFRLAAEPVGSR